MARLLLLNDRAVYNIRYRKPLMEFFESQGHQVRSQGVLESPFAFLRSIAWMVRSDFVISSNLKANFFALIFSPTAGAIIINGLGRYRRSFFLRAFLVNLLRLRRKRLVFVQSYADYRYFSRFLGRSVCWMKGSGGVARRCGNRGESLAVSVVTRADKLASQFESIKRFCLTNPVSELHFVGVESFANSFPVDRVVFHGYVSQEKIFDYSGVLLVPDGYGEGIPHVLVDAIVSGMKVMVAEEMYRACGLYKLIDGLTDQKSNGWKEVNPDLRLVQMFHKDSVVASFIEETIRHKLAIFLD